jgi:multidrug efflux pump subunit AcrA (membrane-fusion protein)
MGGGIQSKELTLPVAPGTVRLVLELPGQTTALDCTVRIAKPDGDPPVVWTSPAPIKSTASATGQIVTVDLNSTILRAADYIVQAIGPDGQTRERYVFRAR